MYWRLEKLLSTTRAVFPHTLKRGFKLGYCPICEKRTLYFKEGAWLRDQLKCSRCGSIPRWRALIYVLNEFVPAWRQLTIHESSPSGPASAKLKSACSNYIPSHFFLDVAPGDYKNGYRCENLEQQTFSTKSLDLVISQDVFEHVLDPATAFKEVARTLKPRGMHVFTIPWYWWKPTLVRAMRQDDMVQHLLEPDYHGNPIDPNGSLVVTEWGYDFCDFIYETSGLTTTVIRIRDSYLGIEGQFTDVFISRKLRHADEQALEALDEQLPSSPVNQCR